MSKINNDFYEDLHEDWYTAADHPIALLRAENKVRIPWIIDLIGKNPSPQAVLDIGCGAGFLTNALAQKGHKVFGIDVSASSLAIAQKKDLTQTVCYTQANAYELPYPDQMFDAICAMDVLEHVENPQKLIAEASRTLKPGGLFFFHTFNRNLLSYFLVIKGVDWCVPNAPKNMHVYPLFIKPEELKNILNQYELQIASLRGFIPKIKPKHLAHMILKKRVPESFSFKFSKKLWTGYCGFAQKIPLAK